jgi:carbonic anhydrase
VSANSIPFDASHPKALAMYCSDGRFTRAVEALLRGIGHQRLDTMTLPGGPALLCTSAANLSEVDTFSRAAHFLIEAHEIAEVVLVAHQGCGYYRNRYSRLPAPQIERLQLEHLGAATKVLQRRHPELVVRRYYARVDGGAVSFEELAQ